MDKIIAICGEELIELFQNKETIDWVKCKLVELKQRLEKKYGEILIITRGEIGVENFTQNIFCRYGFISEYDYKSKAIFHIVADHIFLNDFCDFTIVFTHNPDGNSKLKYLLENGECLWINYGTRKEKWLKKESV